MDEGLEEVLDMSRLLVGEDKLGRRLYDVYVSAMGAQYCDVQPWEELDDSDQRAYVYMARCTMMEDDD